MRKQRENRGGHVGAGGDPPCPSPDLPEAPAVDQRIAAYLDQVCRSLSRAVPTAQRAEVCAEWGSHLQALTEAYNEAGYSNAVERALTRFGEPRRLARAWQEEWLRSLPYGQAPLLWPVVRESLLCLAPTLAPLLLLALPAGAATWLGSHVPYLGALAATLPAAGGLVAGWRTHGRHALGAFCALLLLSLALVLPMAALAEWWPQCGLNGFATSRAMVVLATWWIPAGCAGAAVGGWLHAGALHLRRWLPAA